MLHVHATCPQIVPFRTMKYAAFCKGDVNGASYNTVPLWWLRSWGWWSSSWGTPRQKPTAVSMAERGHGGGWQQFFFKRMISYPPVNIAWKHYKMGFSSFMYTNQKTVKGVILLSVPCMYKIFKNTWKCTVRNYSKSFLRMLNFFLLKFYISSFVMFQY